MPDFEIHVYRDGRFIRTIRRPIHAVNGELLATYKGKRYVVGSGGTIHVTGRTGSFLQPQSASRPASEPSDSPAVSIHWDTEQDAVIKSPASARILVDAGPGTGKTAVACARVAHLINTGVEPANIWIMSFTRTAIHEIRSRIAAHLSDPHQSNVVAIATIDSTAWKMVKGFDADPVNPFPGYDANIDSLIQLLRNPTGDVIDYLHSIEHLIVDEAQDVIATRAELIALLISNLAPETGVTVFADEAQAIYDFAEADKVDAGSEGLSLLDRIRSPQEIPFEESALVNIHRTESATLRDIFRATRAVVLSAENKGASKLAKVRADIEQQNFDRIGNICDQDIAGRDDILILFRQRSDVLTASSFLWSRKVEHRLRMSGLPCCIFPWVARLFWDHVESRVTRSGFEELWHSRVARPDEGAEAATEAWKLLARFGSDSAGGVDLRRVRQRLAATRPPEGLFNPELGSHGPVIGTIHASKGREATRVHLMLPPRSGDISESDAEEEARVAFVGATRARQTLAVGSGYQTRGSKLQSGRVFVNVKSNSTWKRARVELGRDGDTDIHRQVARSTFMDEADARRSQEFLAGVDGKRLSMTAYMDREDDFTYKLRGEGEPDGLVLGCLNAQTVNWDLFALAKRCGGKTGRPTTNEIRYINCVGVRTIAVGADDERLADLHAPFDQSGFFLAPVFIAFTTVTV